MSQSYLLLLVFLSCSGTCLVHFVSDSVQQCMPCSQQPLHGGATRLVLHLRGGLPGKKKARTMKSQRLKSKNLLDLHDMFDLKPRSNPRTKKNVSGVSTAQNKTVDRSASASKNSSSSKQDGLFDPEDLSTNSDFDQTAAEQKVLKQAAILESFLNLPKGDLLKNQTESQGKAETSSSDDSGIDEDKVVQADVRFRRKGHDPNPPDSQDSRLAKLKKYYVPFPKNHSLVFQDNGIVCRVETHPRSVLDIHVPWYEPDVHYKLSVEREKLKKTARLRVVNVSPALSVEEVWDCVSKAHLLKQEMSAPVEVIMYPDKREVDFFVSSDCVDLQRCNRTIMIGGKELYVCIEVYRDEDDKSGAEPQGAQSGKQRKEVDRTNRPNYRECNQILVFNLLFNYQKPLKKLFDTCGPVSSIKFKYISQVRRYVARVTFDRKGEPVKRAEELTGSILYGCVLKIERTVDKDVERSIREAHLKSDAIIPADESGVPKYKTDPRVVDNFTKVEANFNFSHLSHAEMEKILPGSSYNIDTRPYGGNWYSPSGTIMSVYGEDALERGMLSAMTYQPTQKVPAPPLPLDSVAPDGHSGLPSYDVRIRQQKGISLRGPGQR
eukprot:487290-Hanusia_phi.AAC.1